MFFLVQALTRGSHVREKDNSCLYEGMLVITHYETEEHNLFLVNGLQEKTSKYKTKNKHIIFSACGGLQRPVN